MLVIAGIPMATHILYVGLSWFHTWSGESCSINPYQTKQAYCWCRSQCYWGMSCCGRIDIVCSDPRRHCLASLQAWDTPIRQSTMQVAIQSNHWYCIYRGMEWRGCCQEHWMMPKFGRKERLWCWRSWEQYKPKNEPRIKLWERMMTHPNWFFGVISC